MDEQPVTMPRRISDPKANQFAADGPGHHKVTSSVPESFLLTRSKEKQAYLDHRQAELQRELDRSLGEPSFSAPGFILYKLDCLKSLSTIAQTPIKFELTVTSPPYNIGKEYEDISTTEAYVAWCQEWMRAIHDISTDEAGFWLNLGYFEVPEKGLCVPISYLLWDKSPFYFLQEIVWNYAAGVSAKKRLSPRNEKWIWYVKNGEKYTFNLDDIRDPNVKYPNQKKNGKFRCNPLGKNPSDVWQFPKVTSGAKRSSKERAAHPAQFPLPVVERVIKASSNFGDYVLDPFSGSGSTGVAAGALGRIFVGFELRQDYCDAAVNRYMKLQEERGVMA